MADLALANHRLRERLAHWKSDAGRAEYLAAYDGALTLWPVSYESQLVPTRFGDTHAVVSGNPDRPRLLLLPAAIGVGALQWFTNVARLADHFRVYAFDFVGAPGRGTQTQSISDRRDCADWLLDVLTALDINEANVVGSSQGGWFVFNLCLLAPGRVRKAALLAPAASVLPFRRLVLLGIRLGPYMPAFMAGPALKVHFGDRYRIDDRFLRLAAVALRHFRYQRRAVIPAVFPEDELRAARTSILLMVGEHEMIYDPRRALQRATELLPAVDTELVPNAGHLLNIEQAEMVDRRILEHLQ